MNSGTSPPDAPGDGRGEGPVEWPIDGVLDLHTFRPQDVREVVEEYLAACRPRGLRHIRIVHGKGIGQLRQTVHAVLRRHPDVERFDLAGEAYGGWGATMVTLRATSGSA